jgi:HPt (histidine-containing phosphotransfer) domain-containing protein
VSLERVQVVEDAVMALHRDELDPALRERAAHEAHKLAGSVGTFGFPEGTRLARELERVFRANRALDASDATRLSELVTALRRELSVDEPRPVAAATPIAALFALPAQSRAFFAEFGARGGFGVEIEASTEEPKGPCRGRARRRHVKATLLPARRTIAHLVLSPREGEPATVTGELVGALNDAVRRYRNRREADEARLVALPIAAALRREIDERLERAPAGGVAIAAHLEGGKLEVAQRLYGCVEGEWKPVGPEVKVEVADERDEPVATMARPVSAETEQRLVERLAAFIGRVDVVEPTPVEPPPSALRAL